MYQHCNVSNVEQLQNTEQIYKPDWKNTTTAKTSLFPKIRRLMHCSWHFIVPMIQMCSSYALHTSEFITFMSYIVLWFITADKIMTEGRSWQPINWTISSSLVALQIFTLKTWYTCLKLTKINKLTLSENKWTFEAIREHQSQNNKYQKEFVFITKVNMELNIKPAGWNIFQNTVKSVFWLLKPDIIYWPLSAPSSVLVTIKWLIVCRL